MIFWSIAIAVTAIACAALFYAGAGRTVNATAPEKADANSHFRQILAGIDADVASGKMNPDEAAAAKGELAREVLRSRAALDRSVSGELRRGHLLAGLGAVAVVSLGLYAALGNPDLPSQPLADRPEAVTREMALGEAIARIEQRLAQEPDDVRGWTVLAPAYIELGRYDDAVEAFRRILSLSEPTAELETDLAEALLLAADSAGSEEASDLLRSAAGRDATNTRARLYLASELMQRQEYEEAARYWREAIAAAQGDEPWLSAARQGLAVAEADGVDVSAEQQAEMIDSMVSGLAARLDAEGGSIEEWVRLVRSYIMLGDLESAQSAYDAAVAAYPAAFDRGELDTIALGAGLTINGGTP